MERYMYLHMLWSCLTWLSNPLARRSNSWLAKLQMKQTLFLSCSVRNCGGRELIIIKISSDSDLVAHPFIPELWEGVNNDTKDYVETNGGHNDEEGYVIEEPQRSHTELLRNKGNNLNKQTSILKCTFEYKSNGNWCFRVQLEFSIRDHMVFLLSQFPIFKVWLILLSAYICTRGDAYQSEVFYEPVSYGGGKTLIESWTEESGIIVVRSLERFVEKSKRHNSIDIENHNTKSCNP